MKRGTITIDERGNVHIPSTPVWMSACEIATLFGVFSGKVSSHIKSIFKESLLREDEAMQTLSFKGGAVDLYNLRNDNDAVISLSFSTGKALPKMDNQQTHREENTFSSTNCVS